MFSRTNLTIVLVALAGALLGLFAASFVGQPPSRPIPAGVSPLKTGDLRANLQLPGTDGTTRNLSDWDGKLVLLNFWATWCGPCREEMPLLQKVGTDLADSGFRVVGIAIDNDDAVHEFLQSHPVTYPILLGGNATIDPSLIFGDTRALLPFSVLIGRNGRILAQHAGSFSAESLADWLSAHSPATP
ncbi:MAG TPA: TlpA disulfide reductase family protein [Rudaea sp.]|nr:TlpA disulfide reductase family protein [Rudaea sp.]